MKKNVFIFGIFLIILAVFFSCEKQYFEEETKKRMPVIAGLEKGDNFFYYFDERIFFQQRRERVLLKPVPNFCWAHPLLENPDFFISFAFSPYFLLIANDNKPISQSTFESFRAMPEIVSVSYMYRFINGDEFVIESAHTDKFSVELRRGTTFAQLQALANRHGSIVRGRCPYVTNRYNLFVSRTSELNAIQMSRLFYETGLFRFSSPHFRVFSRNTLFPQIPTPFFYYYFGVKMFLHQFTDKISLQFAQNTNSERIISILNSNSSLRPMFEINFEDLPEYLTFPIVTALESKDGKPIPSAVIESFKAKDEIVSVSHLYRPTRNLGGQGFIGFTNTITVRLRGTTTFRQLEDLAERYNFTIEEENQFVRNQFRISVPKNAKLNALRMSNLLFETGLFHFAEPNLFGISGGEPRTMSATNKQFDIIKLK